MGDNGRTPFASFGRRLKALRESAKESVDEVSGAVEIAKEDLIRIENGEMRPPEEVLDLLVAHFNLADKEEERLWELAGYKTDETTGDPLQSVASIMLMPIDARIVYSDMAQVTINNYGVVMNFMQIAGGKQPLAIARIGMSKEHARSVLELLQKTLGADENQKLLDNPDNKETSK